MTAVAEKPAAGPTALPEPFITIGPPNARTDPETGLRFYKWQGRELPSVTTIRRMAGLPYGLHWWVIGQVVDHAVGRAPEHVKRLSAAEDREAVSALIRSELRAAATEKRDAAGRFGRAIHQAAEAGLSPDQVPLEQRARLRQFYHWLEYSRAEAVAREFQVFNLDVGYAGQCDLLARLPDGSVWVVDLKTGSVHSEFSLQVIAYLMGEFVGRDDAVDQELTDQLHRAKGIAVLHLEDDGWEFIALRLDQETWDAFRGLLAFGVWLHAHPSIASVTVARRTGSAPVEPAA